MSKLLACGVLLQRSMKMATHKSSGISARMELASGSRDSLSRSKEAQPLDNSSVRSKQSTQVSSCAGSRRSSSGHESLASNRISHARSAKQSSGRPYRIWEALPAWTLEFQGLTPIQQDVMQYVANVAEVESPAAKARLMKAWSVYNIPEADFVAIEVYLAKKVPLTIRLDIQNLFPHLLYDPFYRTTFETMVRGTAYLEARREFERVLFNGLYDHPSVLAKDRPKYGVLNMVCNPFSDTRVSCFGSAYFLLKDSLRTSCKDAATVHASAFACFLLEFHKPLMLAHCMETGWNSARTTVATSKENLGANVRRVGTVDRLWHVIETLSPHEITRIHAVATGRRAKATVSPDCKYSEIQIHGMLDIRKDVAAIVVQRQDLQCPSRGPLVEELSKTYLIPILTCEELDELLEDRRWSTVVNQRANMLFQKTMAMNDASFHTTTRW